MLKMLSCCLGTPSIHTFFYSFESCHLVSSPTKTQTLNLHCLRTSTKMTSLLILLKSLRLQNKKKNKNIYIYIYIYIYMHTHARAHTHTHTHTHIYIYIRMVIWIAIPHRNKPYWTYIYILVHLKLQRFLKKTSTNSRIFLIVHENYL